MSTFIENLKERGMFHAMIPGTETQLAKERTSAYIGFDPTAPSLHIGNLATLMLLKHFQRAGHRPVLLLGGATGMIGDPSFNASERDLLDRDTLEYHQQCIRKQIEPYLDFDGPSGALLLNNYEWFKEMSVFSFLRDIGKHISINYMMGKESVKARLKTGISYTEFAYQLLQGYDFYYMFTHYGIKMQMGGSDQWGNVTTGTELIRRKAGGQAYALTTPLITKSDGTKFGKTKGGNIWLDPTMTSPYAFYQFFINCSDEDALMLLKRMTLHSMEEIYAWKKAHDEAPHYRVMQKALAKALTIFVHSPVAYEEAMQASDILFGNAPSLALLTLQESLLVSCLQGVPQIELTVPKLKEIDSLVNLLTEATGNVVFKSKREAREIIEAGGLAINKTTRNTPNALPSFTWLHGKYLVVQKGKKHFYLIKLVDQ